jgi:hypothetical protein
MVLNRYIKNLKKFACIKYRIKFFLLFHYWLQTLRPPRERDKIFFPPRLADKETGKWMTKEKNPEENFWLRYY